MTVYKLKITTALWVDKKQQRNFTVRHVWDFEVFRIELVKSCSVWSWQTVYIHYHYITEGADPSVAFIHSVVVFLFSFRHEKSSLLFIVKSLFMGRYSRECIVSMCTSSLGIAVLNCAVLCLFYAYKSCSCVKIKTLQSLC